MKSFTDHAGNEWTPKLYTPQILAICDALDIGPDKIFEAIKFAVSAFAAIKVRFSTLGIAQAKSIDQISDADFLEAIAALSTLDIGETPVLFTRKLSDIIRCSWHTVEGQARERGVGRESFLEQVLTPDLYVAFALALGANFIGAFPQAKKIVEGALTDNAPLAHGQLKPSSNSAGAPDEAPAKN